jgi:hypothetical protein
MKTQKLNVILTTVNFAFLFWLGIAAKSAPETSSDAPPVLRAQMIELVDARGQVRAQLKVETDGEAVFRMRDATGAVRVKLGASADGSGLVLLNDATEPGLQALANKKGTTLTLKNKDGRTRAIEP